MAPEFRVVAIVAPYNEADIIAQVVADLIDQGVHVYLIDDGSTDGTAAAVETFVGRGLLAVEASSRGADPSTNPFDWTRILQRKAAIARELDADWCIHHDADEFRESPWRGVTLRDALQRVDAAGFNAIDFASLDFWPVHDRFRPGDDVRASFTHYAERAPYDRVQVRAWKNTGVDVDLASSGGHDAQFSGRRVFPLRFIARHYPIRGQAHGARKVFQERVGRFRADERARGWHVQYDDMVEGASFIRDRSTLTEYDPDAVRMALTLRHRDVEALEAALDEARCVVEAQCRELDARAGEIEARSRALDEAARELEHRARDVESHRRELERHHRAIENDQREIAARGDALARTTAELAATRAELERCAAYVASVEAESDRRGRYGSSLEAQLARATADVAEREAALADRTSTLEATSARLAEVEAESAARAREIAAARDFVAHQSRAIDGLEHAVADAERRVETVHRSLSWRLTAPARALLRAMRGR